MPSQSVAASSHLASDDALGTPAYLIGGGGVMPMLRVVVVVGVGDTLPDGVG
jgi:hypothetical protein